MFSGAGTHSASASAGASDGGGSGSPSDMSAAAIPSASALFSTPPASESTVGNGLDIQVADGGTPTSQPATRGGVAPSASAPFSMPSPPSAMSKKKKKGARAVGPDKNGRGLRQFSMRVCEKVESKGTTTYNEVADELVAEFSNLNTSINSLDVDNPSATKVTGLKDRIAKKTAILKDLEGQYACVHNLVQRNKQLYEAGDEPSSKLALPFILAHQESHGNLEVEMDEDSHNVHLDFNITPFQLKDEAFVMKAMGLCGNKETNCIDGPAANGGECSSTPSNYWHQSVQPPRARAVWVPNSHPTPGILKGHAKHERKEQGCRCTPMICNKKRQIFVYSSVACLSQWHMHIEFVYCFLVLFLFCKTYLTTTWYI